MPFKYPIALELGGRLCVVVGGGILAEHKVIALLDAGALVRIVAPEFTLGLESLARAGFVKLVRRAYRRGDLTDAFLAIAATDDGEVNAAAFEEAEQNKVLMNAVDDVDHCHFAVPSIVRRGELILAVSTGGRAPSLAKRLRMRLQREFGEEYGTLVELMGDVREELIASREVGFDEWARRWQRALDHDLIGHIRRGYVDEARSIIENEVLGHPSPPIGRVAIVGAGPGDPRLITVRGSDLLESADVVVVDRLVDRSLLKGKETIYVGKEPGRGISQTEINKLLIELAEQGRNVVRLKGGDPFVFGRGGEEAEALADAGVPFEVVPAPTAAVAAAAYAGIPLTDRRFSSSVVFVTGHTSTDWKKIAEVDGTIVVFMGLANIEAIAQSLILSGRDPHEPAAVIENGTTDEQRVVTASLENIAREAREQRIVSPALIVIGPVVALREKIDWFYGTSNNRPSDEDSTASRENGISWYRPSTHISA